MKKRFRVIPAIAAAEVAMVGLWLYLEALASEHPERVAADFHRVLGSTIGTAMGVLLGFGLLLFLIAAKRDRTRRER